MPSQLIHLDICAAALAGRLPSGLEGPYYLGAITPDAWAVAGGERAALHFWSLEDDTSGLIRMARSHPRLAAPGDLPASQRAFLAGYLCHLVTDEQWTFSVYRPFFGRHSPLRASPEGRRLQVVLLGTMEQALRDERGDDLAGWLRVLAGALDRHTDPQGSTLSSVLPPELGALPAGALRRWGELQLEASRLPGSREAFRYVLERSARLTDPGQGERLDAGWDALAARAGAYVPREALTLFRARALAACGAVLAAWLPAEGLPATAVPTPR